MKCLRDLELENSSSYSQLTKALVSIAIDLTNFIDIQMTKSKSDWYDNCDNDDEYLSSCIWLCTNT